MQVREIMHAGAEWCTPDTTAAELAQRMRDDDIGSIPVGENDRLIGMVTDRDIVVRAVAERKDPATVTARDIMTSDIVWCYDDATIEEACELMRDREVRRLAVVNRDKRMVGIVSVGDLTAASPEIAGATLRSLSAVDDGHRSWPSMDEPLHHRPH